MCRLISIRRAYFKVSFCLLHQVNLSKLPKLHLHPHLSHNINHSRSITQREQPPQPKPTVQEQKPKPRISAKEFLRAVREHAIEHGVPPELVDYERILEEARREAEEEEK